MRSKDAYRFYGRFPRKITVAPQISTAVLNLNCVPKCFLRSEDNCYLDRIGFDMEPENTSLSFIIPKRHACKSKTTI